MRLIDDDTLIKDLSYLYTKNHIPVDMRAKKHYQQLWSNRPLMMWIRLWSS